MLGDKRYQGWFFVMRNAWKDLKCLLAALWLGLLVCGPLAAQESVCVRVKIDIKQELTPERQAFDAEMRITNSPGLSVERWMNSQMVGANCIGSLCQRRSMISYGVTLI